MRKRIIVGTSLAALLFALLLLDGYIAPRTAADALDVHRALEPWHWLSNGAICTAVVLVLTALATHELVHLARGRGYRPYGRTAQLFAVMLVVGPYISFNLAALTGDYDESWGMLWMAIAVSYVFLLQAIRRGAENTMENLAITIFIIFYAGGLGGFMTKLRMEVGGPTGMTLLIFSIFLVKITDTGAYFVGKAWGRHKMVPWLSPRKTWEGFVGGMATTVLLAIGLGHWLHVSGIVRVDETYYPHWAILALLGVLLGLFSVAGDLCASLLKRDAAVKDSGQAFPGLGGVLDVLDSPLLAAPVAWFFWTRMFHVVT